MAKQGTGCSMMTLMKRRLHKSNKDRTTLKQALPVATKGLLSSPSSSKPFLLRQCCEQEAKTWACSLSIQVI